MSVYHCLQVGGPFFDRSRTVTVGLKNPSWGKFPPERSTDSHVINGGLKWRKLGCWINTDSQTDVQCFVAGA